MLIILTILIGLTSLYFWNYRLNEQEQKFSESHLYFDKKMAENNKKVILEAQKSEMENGDFEAELEKDALYSKSKIQKYDSFVSKNQAFYLTQDSLAVAGLDYETLISNNYIFEENSNIHYLDFIQGTTEINNKLLKAKYSKKSTRYGVSGMLFVVSILYYIASPIGTFILLVVFGIPHFKKYEDKTIRLILTLPLRKYKIILSDLTIFIIKSNLFVISILFFCFILGWLVTGEMEIDYPILITLLGQSVTKPAYMYVLRIFILNIFSLSFIFLLTNFLVVFSKKSFFSVILSVFLIIVLGAFSQKTTLIKEDLSFINPFIYTQPSKILIGRSMEQINFVESSSGDDDTLDAIIENEAYQANFSFGKINANINSTSLIIVLLFFSAITFLLNNIIINFKNL